MYQEASSFRHRQAMSGRILVASKIWLIGIRRSKVRPRKNLAGLSIDAWTWAAAHQSLKNRWARMAHPTLMRFSTRVRCRSPRIGEHCPWPQAAKAVWSVGAQHLNLLARLRRTPPEQFQVSTKRGSPHCQKSSSAEVADLLAAKRGGAEIGGLSPNKN